MIKINFQHNPYLKIVGLFSLISIPFIISIKYTCSGEECMGMVIFIPLLPFALSQIVITLIRIKSIDKWDIFFSIISLIASLFLIRYLF